MTFVPGAASLPPAFPVGSSQGGSSTVSSPGGGFNATMDELAPPGGQSGPEFPTLVPPATSLSQPTNIPGMSPMLGPGAPGPISGVGQLFKPLGDWLGEVNAQLDTANHLGKAFAAGENVNLHDVMLANEEADIGLSLTTQIRSKLLNAYQTVMNMQV